MINEENLIENIKNGVDKEKKILKELVSMFNSLGEVKDNEEKDMISSQIESLKKSLKEENDKSFQALKRIYLAKPLVKNVPIIQPKQIEEVKQTEISPQKIKKIGKFGNELKLLKLEKQTLKRLKKKEKKGY